MYLTPNDGSNMSFVMRRGDEVETLTAKRLTGTNWRHVAVTIADEKVTIWVDGEEVASTEEMSLSPEDIAPVICNIGRSQSDNDPLLKGYVDDVRIYNYPLSAEELAEVMNDTDTAVDELTVDDGQPNGAEGEMYDLVGRRLSLDSRGLVIVNGKKYYVK